MNIEELREYLGIVVDMEQNIFFQRSLWNHITQEIERLRIPKNIIDPSEPVKPKPLSTSYIWGVIVLIGSSFGLWFASMLVIMVFLELHRSSGFQRMKCRSAPFMETCRQFSGRKPLVR